MKKHTRKSFVAGLAVVPLALGLAIAPAVSASAATGQLSVRNNCGYAIEYRVYNGGSGGNGGGIDYATPGQIRNWNPTAGTWYIMSSAGTHAIYVAPNRGTFTNIC